MKTKNNHPIEYTNLEEMILREEKSAFRIELQKASRPMLEVLKKYGIKYGDDVLNNITLLYPHHNTANLDYAVFIPNDIGLESLDDKILKDFLTKINEK